LKNALNGPRLEETDSNLNESIHAIPAIPGSGRSAKSKGRSASQVAWLHAYWPWVTGIVVLAIGTFAAGLFNARIGDDDLILLHRLDIQHFIGLFQYFGQSYWADLHTGGLYRPVTLWLLGAQKLIFGINPVGYHAVSLLLHAAGSVLCLRLFSRFISMPAAFIGAAVFACHPIHAEAVITVYGQSDLWAAVFFLAGLDRYIAWPKPSATWWRGPVVYGLYLLSLGCKESAVLGPLAAVCIRGLYHETDQVGWHRWISWREALFALPLGAYLIARFLVLDTPVPLDEASVAWGYPLWARANLLIVTLGTYFKLLVLPWEQTIYYGHLRDAIFGQPWGALGWLFAALFGLWGLSRVLNRRHTHLANSWLGWSLLPIANLLPIGTVVAERCLYLPSVAVALLLGCAFDKLRQYRHASTWLIGLAIVILVSSMALSVRVCWRWRTPVSLWQATTVDHPRSPKAHAALAMALLAEMVNQKEVLFPSNPRWTIALQAADQALILNNRSADAWHAKGLMAMARNDYADALPHLETAYQLRPNDRKIYHNLQDCRRAMDR